MARRFLAFLLMGGLFLAVGCGVREHEVPEAPTVDELLEEAWQKYRTEADFEGAWEIFDSVIVVDAYQAEAHLGAGFCAAQVRDYTSAFGSFALASLLTTPLFEDTILSEYLDTTALTDPVEILVDTSWDPVDVRWRYRLRYPYDSILGIEEFTVAGVTQHVEAYSADENGNTWIYVNGPAPFVGTGDTLLEFKVRVKKWLGGVDPSFEAWYSVYGCATAYMVYGDEYETGTAYSKCAWLTVSTLDTSGIPDRVSKSIPVPSQERLGYLLAYHYFKGGYYPNAVAVLHQLDPSWPSATWDINEYNDYIWAMSPVNLSKIVEKINSGLGGSF